MTSPIPRRAPPFILVFMENTDTTAHEDILAGFDAAGVRLGAEYGVTVTVTRVQLLEGRLLAVGRAGVLSWSIVASNGRFRVEVGSALDPEHLVRHGGEAMVRGLGCGLSHGLPEAVKLAVASHRFGQLELARRRVAA